MMVRLPNLNARQLLQALKRAGSSEGRQRGSHLALYNPITNTISMHSGDVSRGLFKKILRPAGLTEDEFVNFI